MLWLSISECEMALVLSVFLSLRFVWLIDRRLSHPRPPLASIGSQAVAELRADATAKCASPVDAKTGLKIPFLGFDTETRPKFTKGGGPNPIALIQLAGPILLFWGVFWVASSGPCAC